MRPIRLEMEGFSTFRERVEVDFTDIDVVALVGPTGSGKSTIIDAITFALYGSVARYDDRGAVAPVINQLSPEAKVSLEFMAAGRQFRAVRIVRRTKTGASTKEARLECAGEVLAGDARGLDAAIKDLLGLDFERFNKTVVLPQGKFATFLHDKPADRQQLLRELLGMGVYERLGRLARTRSAVSESQLQVLEPQAVTSEELSDARMAELVADHAAAGEARLELAEAATRHEQLTSEMASHEQQGAHLLRQLEDLNAVQIPNGLGALESQIEEATHAALLAETALDAARDQRRTCDQAVKDGPSAFRIEALIQQHEQLTELTGRQAMMADQQGAAVRQQASATATAQLHRHHLEGARAALESARADHQSAREAAQHQPDIRSLEAELAAFERRDGLRVRQSGIEAALQAAQDALVANRKRSELAEQARRQVVNRAPALVLAAALQVGEPCPVCQQTVHDPVDVGPNNGALDTADAELAAAIETVRSALDASTQASAMLAALTTELEGLDRQLASAPTAKVIEQLLVEGRANERAIAAMQQTVSAAESALRGLEQSPEAQRALAEEATAANAVVAIAAQIAALTEQREQLADLLVDVPSVDELAGELTRAHQLADDQAGAERAESAAEATARSASTTRELVRSQEESARAEYQRVRDAVAAQSPPPANGQLVGDWRALDNWADQRRELLIEEAQATTDTLQRLAAATAQVVLSAQTCCQRLVEQPSPTIAHLREQMAGVEQRLSSDIQRLTERRMHFERLATQVAELRNDRDVANMLGNLLRSDGFEKWLLQEVLEDLVGRATVRLNELSSGQFSLISADGGFQICDHRNADEVRDARTLSGGETFLASLSLALALADASGDLAAVGSAPLESIFLDEGFGTLDPETLDIVASTLEELGATGRMVGVVTHIRELAERMPIRLEVAKGPTTSTVTRVEA